MSEVVNANRGDALTQSHISFPWEWELGKPAVKNTGQ
jgi:hypothetical protein